MWTKPWRLREGFVIGAGLLVTGLMLQLSIGPIDWQSFAYPVNVIVLALLLAIIILTYAMRPRVYACRYMTTTTAAVPALIYTVVLTAVMGLTKQLPSGPLMLSEPSLADTVGLTRMLSFWPFVLIYVWLTLLLGEVVIHRLLHLRKGRQLWTRDLPTPEDDGHPGRPRMARHRRPWRDARAAHCHPTERIPHRRISS